MGPWLGWATIDRLSSPLGTPPHWEDNNKIETVIIQLLARYALWSPNGSAALLFLRDCPYRGICG